MTANERVSMLSTVCVFLGAFASEAARQVTSEFRCCPRVQSFALMMLKL